MSNFCPGKPPWCFFQTHMFKTARLVLTGCDLFFLDGLWEEGGFLLNFVSRFSWVVVDPN